jgi:hypothetical protein
MSPGIIHDQMMHLAMCGWYLPSAMTGSISTASTLAAPLGGLLPIVIEPTPITNILCGGSLR